MFSILRSLDHLRKQILSWRSEGLSVGLVPTMGALHSGHMALVSRSLEACDRTLVTLFINPRQFCKGEDFEYYPRDEQKDAKKLEAAGAHFLFVPKLEEIYPNGFSTRVRVSGLSDLLEGVHRPRFFDSVATIVIKLLNQTGADRAFFGEKDYQQLMIIKRMAHDLDITTVIEGVETVREDDGLAMSSRNIYLNEEERQTAAILYKTLVAVAKHVKEGNEVVAQEDWGREKLLNAGFSSVDYFSILDAETLLPSIDVSRVKRVLAAAKLGRTRLIDNVLA
jgi:pantoate--beta-alanine ligase